jgi:hypothetical protein
VTLDTPIHYLVLVPKMKDEVKPTLWAWNIACRVMPSTQYMIIYPVIAVAFTSSLVIMWRWIR